MQMEGCVLHTYLDSVGISTIGVGHVVRPGESFPNGISREQALTILAQDVQVAEKAIDVDVKVSLTQNQGDAIASFIFNVGVGAFATSTLLKKLNTGDLQGAADEFLKWTHGGGKVIQGLVNRRQAERELFLKGTVIVQKAPPSPDDVGHAAKEIIETVRSYVGCSLKARRDDLGRLVARGVDDPEKVVTIATNCATTALGIMKQIGVEHPLLSKPYVNGMAVAWVRQVAQDLGALVKFDGHTLPKPGSLLRYNTVGKNDDHVEWLMGPVDEHGSADHAGGGRTDNAITEGTGAVLTNWNRPLVEWVDPDRLLPALTEPPQPVTEAPAEVEPEAPTEPAVPEPTEPVPEPVTATAQQSGSSVLSTILGFMGSLFGGRR